MIEGDALRPSGRSQTGRSKLARCGILLLASASFLVSSCGDRLAAAQAGADRRSPEAAQLQTVDFAEFPSTPWRKSAAHALLADCEAGLTAVPPALPSVRLTEDGPGGIAALRREFARWQVATIFTGCTELMHEILAAEDARQETRA